MINVYMHSFFISSIILSRCTIELQVKNKMKRNLDVLIINYKFSQFESFYNNWKTIITMVEEKKNWGATVHAWIIMLIILYAKHV